MAFETNHTHYQPVKLFFSAVSCFVFILFTAATGFCIDISDDPMESKVQAAPPNIMFILDNSGSMDWEFMTKEDDGKFTISGSTHEYLFTDPGDNNYSAGSSNGTTLSGSDRAHWKSQWSGYNKIYFNPHAVYVPWPGTDTYTMENASLTEPFSNPIHTDAGDPSIRLIDTFLTIPGISPIIVDNIDAGFTTPSGTWSESGYEHEWPHPGTVHSSVYTDTNGGRAVFTPNIPTSGDYRVYAWWNCFTNRDENAKITISHNGGPTVLFKSQRSSVVTNNEPGVCGEWIDLGSYNFDEGSGGSVTIERHDGSTGGSTVADAVKFVPDSGFATEEVSIKNAHYYTWYDENGNGAVDNLEVYLVTWEDTDSDNRLDLRKYYQVDDKDGDDIIEMGELRPLSYNRNNQGSDGVPDAVQSKIFYEEDGSFKFKTDDQDLQSFANWYSYYRRRELTAKAAVAKSVLDLDWVYAGFYTINSGVRQPVLPINVESDAIVIDNKDSGFTVSGTWKESGAESHGKEYNNSSLYSYTGTAKWTPYLPAAGTYNVYAWWGYAGNRTTTAQYTIHHGGADSTVVKNHDEVTEAFKWQLLGTYSFDEGSGGYVTVQNIGSSGKVASADAIRFEKTTGGVSVDETNRLLDQLYGINSNSGTPLRAALRNVGRYYDQDDSNDGNLGSSPFKTEDEGGACQQAFTILMTDGYYNGSDPGVGNQDGSAESPYRDSYSDTLADIAFQYYNTDLSDSLPNNLPTNVYDKNRSQHMVTYSVSFGVTGSIDPTDMDNDGNRDSPTYEEDPYFLNEKTPHPTWPDPTAGDAEKIDDLWHAAVNGRGEFFSAEDPDELVSSLNSVFENLTSRIASGASVSVNGNELSTGSTLYQSTYISGDWVGDVIAYPIDPITGEIKKEAGDILWKASDRLQNQDWDTGRRLVTFNGTNDILPFRYDNLTSAQKAALHATEATARDMVDYLRGKEVSGFRPRTQKLGDIIHSAPLLVIGDSRDNNGDDIVDEDGEENGIIFAGGNDGILHAFDAETGDELFGYIPHLVFDNLKELAAMDYTHKFYVDATPFARTVTINSADKVLLAGGLKKGGKGYYCLDITNILYQDSDAFSETELATPSHADGISVLWEYPQLDTPLETESDGSDGFDDIGYSFSDIFIAETYAANNSPGNHNWAAFFGNGYNSINGSAVLYILNAYTGELIRKIDTMATGNNGLSTPALIDYNSDGKIDVAYAGDLLGNMWKFDLTDSNPALWKVAFSYSDGRPAPLFSAATQPITSAPDVMFHSEVDFDDDADKPELMVLFATGKFLGETDRGDLSQQSIYGIWDSGFPLGEWDRVTQTLSERPGAKLLEQTEVDFRFFNPFYLRTLSDHEADWVTLTDTGGVESGTHIGWFFDLPMDFEKDGTRDGERVIQDVMIRDGKLILITFTPDLSPCTGGGISMVMEMDAADGSRLTDPQFDINGTRTVDKSDLIEIEIDDPDKPGEKIKIWVPPTGITYNGILQRPIIVTMPDRITEMKIFSSSAGTTEQLFERTEGGFYYWQEIKSD